MLEAPGSNGAALQLKACVLALTGRKLIIGLAAKYKLPAAYYGRHFPMSPMESVHRLVTRSLRSARAMWVCGTVMPSALAVLRLTPTHAWRVPLAGQSERCAPTRRVRVLRRRSRKDYRWPLLPPAAGSIYQTDWSLIERGIGQRHRGKKS